MLACYSLCTRWTEALIKATLLQLVLACLSHGVPQLRRPWYDTPVRPVREALGFPKFAIYPHFQHYLSKDAVSLPWAPRPRIVKMQPPGHAVFRCGVNTRTMWGNCIIEHALGRLLNLTMPFGGNSQQADFQLVEHCLCQRLEEQVNYCTDLHQTKRRVDCYLQKKEDTAVFFSLLVNASKKRVGAQDAIPLMILGSLAGRTAALALHTASDWVLLTYVGASDWQRVTQVRVGRLGAPSSPPIGRCNELARSSKLIDTSLFSYPSYWPHDVTIPGPPTFNLTQAWSGAGNRTILAFFSGSRTHCSRDVFFEQWQGEKGLKEGMVVLEGTIPERYTSKRPRVAKRYATYLQGSRFCVVLDGHSTLTNRFIESLTHGCVPVMLSDFYRPPWHRTIDWAKAPVIFLGTAEIPRLPEILRSIPYHTWLTLQQETYYFYRFLDRSQRLYWEVLGYELRIVAERRRALPRRCEDSEDLERWRQCGKPDKLCFSCCSRGVDDEGADCWPMGSIDREQCCPPT